MKRLACLILILFTGIVLTVGCAKKATKETPVQDLDSPEWVRNGSGAFDKEKEKVFYGVASAYGIKNHSLLRSAADNRARNEVAKLFQFYTSSLMKDYSASTMAGDPDTTSEEQHVEEAVKTVTTMTLSGVEIVEHWQHPASGELFSLARLDLESFKDNLEKARNLDRSVREYIKENADRLHKELEKEEELRRDE
jgi:hypothetical protein